MESTYKPIVIRETEDIAVINSSEKNVLALFGNGLLKNYNTTNNSSTNQSKLGGNTSSINTNYLSENGNFAALGTDNNSVLIYDVKNPNQPHTLSGHNGLVRAVAFANDASIIATGGRDSLVIVWKNYSQSKKIKCNARIKSLAFSNDNSKLFIGSEDGIISQYIIGGDDKQSFASSNGRVQTIECSASGKIIAAGFSSGVIQLYNSKGNVTRTLNETGSVDFISLDEKNDLLICATANKIIHIYHLSDLSQKPIEINCPSSISAMSVNNGDFIYAACADKTIRMYPVHTSWLQNILASGIKRDFTKEEWNTNIGSDVPYKK
jgi:WD40 repeat protein